MDRRSILKSLIAAPIAAVTFNKVSKAEEKITYGKIDLDEKIPEIDLKELGNCSGTYMNVRCSG